MKKIYIYFFIIMIAACSESSSLGGAYYISQGDSSHVYIWKKTTGQSMIVVDDQVVDWKRVGDYVAVLRKIAESPDCYDKQGVPTIITHYSNVNEFWILDLKSNVEYGPYNIEAYKSGLSRLGLPYVLLHEPKNYFTNTEDFKREIKNCVKVVF